MGDYLERGGERVPGGNLTATAAAVTRFRTVLEASRSYQFGSRLSLKPTVELGLRQDGGDAETGAGADFAGGVELTDPATGLSVDVRVRTLVAHQAEGFRDRGVSMSLNSDPTSSTPLGVTARVARHARRSETPSLRRACKTASHAAVLGSEVTLRYLFEDRQVELRFRQQLLEPRVFLLQLLDTLRLL